jgi:hypothetical protein
MLRRLRVRSLAGEESPAVSWLTWAAVLPVLLPCIVAAVVAGLVSDDGPDDREPIEL